MTEYKEWACMESHGVTSGFIGVKILVAVDRDYNREQDWLGDLAEEIRDRVWKGTVELNPETRAAMDRLEEEFRSLFPGHVYMKRTPNQYCSQPCCISSPWFIVTTPAGRFTIGWRKRVMSIDYSDTVVETPACVLFSDEPVTKEGRLIHAYSYDDARKYIKRIYEAADEPRKDQP
jgi:hypothetical protein